MKNTIENATDFFTEDWKPITWRIKKGITVPFAMDKLAEAEEYARTRRSYVYPIYMKNKHNTWHGYAVPH